VNTIGILVTYALLAAGAEVPEAGMGLGERLSTPHWSIAPEVSWFHYEEPDIMEEEGMLYGVAVAYTRYTGSRFDDGIFRFEGGFSAGEVDYDGSLMDGTPYSSENNDDYLGNARLLWGPLWQTETWANHLYAGLGYRYLQDDSSDDPSGYRRQSNYFYLPLGARAYRTMGGDWYLELGGEFDVLLFGLQISEVEFSSEVDPNVTAVRSVENWQWPGVGLRGSVAVRHKSASLDVAVAPFVQYWWVDDSASEDGLYEPRNWSLQAGLNLILRF
jgi:hypothetical protein